MGIVGRAATMTVVVETVEVLDDEESEMEDWLTGVAEDVAITSAVVVRVGMGSKLVRDVLDRTTSDDADDTP